MFFGFHIPVVESVSPKLDGVKAAPSIKLKSAMYPFVPSPPLGCSPILCKFVLFTPKPKLELMLL